MSGVIFSLSHHLTVGTPAHMGFCWMCGQWVSFRWVFCPPLHQGLLKSSLKLCPQTGISQDRVFAQAGTTLGGGAHVRKMPGYTGGPLCSALRGSPAFPLLGPAACSLGCRSYCHKVIIPPNFRFEKVCGGHPIYYIQLPDPLQRSSHYPKTQRTA